MLFNTIFHSILLLAASFANPVVVAMETKEPTLILNMENQSVLPKNFRTTLDPLAETTEKLPSIQGLRTLSASASGQFSEKSLNEILKHIPHSNILIVDLRQESHGFLDGMAVSWYGEHDWANVDKNLVEIAMDERSRLGHIQERGFASVFDHESPIPVYTKNVIQEETLVASKKLHYKRIPVTDHCKPSSEAVDDFLAMIKNLNSDTWIHFHCAAGRGRSTTFIVMYDMLKNAKDVSFDDIVLRHSLLGGKDLMKPPAQDLWKYPYLVERQKFLKEFYQYSKEADFRALTWTAWLSRQKSER